MRIYLLFLLIIGLPGCSSMMAGGGTTGGSATVGVAGVGTKTLGTPSASADDSAITTAVERRLAADRDVSAHGIKVRTRNGRVTLSGSVGARGAYDQAERLAIQTAGVKSVANRIMVQPTL